MLDPSSASLGLLGAGAQAREIASYAGRDITFYAVESAHLDDRPGLIDIGNPDAAQRETEVVAAVGAPALRRRLVERWAGERFATLRAASAHVAAGVHLEAGCVLAPNSVVMVDCWLGAHTQVNVGATVSHDARFGDFVTVAPGAHVGGGCSIGAGAVIGIGATLINGVSLAEGVVVGAGAVVVGDIDRPNTVVVGVPARAVGIREDWLDEL